MAQQQHMGKRRFPRRLRTFALGAALLLAVAAMGLYAYYNNLTSKIQHNEGYYYATETETQEEQTGLAVGFENVNARSLDEFLRTWAKNGIQKLEDKNVLNILLCGVDSKNGRGLGGRSDAMVLISINRKDKCITLTSFFRDCYSYIDLSGDPNHPRQVMDRVNSAYSLGGPATLVDTLENNYKIVIDGFISADFVSFPKLINALGGVTLDVTQKEADYINRTAPAMKGKFPAGKQVHLSGQQALVFARIRKLDSDVNRTARQRAVISALIGSAREATPRQILDSLRAVPKHVTTNFSEDAIDQLARDMIAQGWLKYDVKHLHSPTVPEDGAAPTGSSTYINDRWLWVVDYPREAQRLQRALYGVTSIRLAQAGREDYLAELFRKAGDRRTTKPATTSSAPATTTEPESESTKKPLFPWFTKAQETTAEPALEESSAEALLTETAAATESAAG